MGDYHVRFCERLAGETPACLLGLVPLVEIQHAKIYRPESINNRVEQDHRFIKWRVRNMPGFKSFESASRTLAGIEIVRMIKKEQVTFPEITYFERFCSMGSYLLG